MISTVAASAIGSISLLWFTPAEPLRIPLAAWTPRAGDHMVVDTESNMGYLLRSDHSSYTEFMVITGQKRVVRYLGMMYNAATPNWHWVVKSRHIKGDHVTFGPTGRFLRLYRNGEDHTYYGIHEHRSEARMFSEADRYQSMGCVIVQRDVLDVIEKTYELNGETLNVVTQAGIGPGPVAHSQSAGADG